jgi:glucuronokinase
LLDFYDVGHLVKIEDRPSIILSAEEDIGITAGLQDRVVQVYGGLVYMVCT